MNKRVKELRSALGLTQEEFGIKIGLSRDEVKNIEYKKTSLKDRIVPLICRIYNANEEWLRNGEGDMFRKQTTDEEIAAFMGDVLSGDPDFRRKLISVLARMTPDEWELLERKIREISE